MSALKFRVLLDRVSDKEVFRDVLIDENAHFETFYHLIIQAFGFSGKQLASFYMSNDEWDKGQEIGFMDMQFNDENNDLLLMSKTTLRSMIEVQDQKIILVYDFLKMWIFLIELQAVIEEKIKDPRVVLSVGKAPDENEKPDNFDMEEEEVLDDMEGEEDYFDEYGSYDDEDFSDGFEEFDQY